MADTTSTTTPSPFQSETQADKTKQDLYEAYQASKKALVDVKVLAVEKLVEAEHSMAQLTSAGADKMSHALHQAWGAYDVARIKVWDFGKSSLDAATHNFETARTALAEATRNLQDHLKQYKDKTAEKTAEGYHLALEKLEKAQADAALKYHSARDVLSRLYVDAHSEAVKDYTKAQELLSQTTDKLKKFAEDASAKTHANYEVTKQQLELTRQKAQDAFQTSKKKAEELREHMTQFNQAALKSLEENYEAMKIRASDALTAFNTYSQDAQAKSSEGYEEMKKKLQSASDSAAENLRKLEQAMVVAKDNTLEWTKSNLDSLSKQNLQTKEAL